MTLRDNPSRLKYLLWLVVMLCAMPVGKVQAEDRILVIHSYHQEFDWVQGVNKGVMENLGNGQDPLIYYMDTKRQISKNWKLKAARKAKALLHKYHPNVVIAVDDNAQKYFASEFVDKFSIPFVFCGVNEEPEKYGYPAANVVGILERTYTRQALELLKKIFPHIRNVAWVSDYSPTSSSIRGRIESMVKENKLPLDLVTFKQPVTFKQWQQTINALDKDPGVQALLIPLYHTVKAPHDEGQSMLPAAVMAWTVNTTSKPIIGLWPFSTNDGALCVVAVDPYEHGKVAALMARQILSGKKPSELPTVVNHNSYTIINLKTAHMLGVEIPFEVLQGADQIID